MDSSAATVFAGRYRVIRRLGAGGSGAVFLACDERLRREVAVKRIHGAEVTTQTAQRLQRTARSRPRLPRLGAAAARLGVCQSPASPRGKRLATALWRTLVTGLAEQPHTARGAGASR